MHAKLSLLLCFVTVTILSACSFTRQSQVARTEHAPPGQSDISFIKDISINPDNMPSVHDVKAYNSESLPSRRAKRYASALQKKFADFLDVSAVDVIPNPTLWHFIDNWWGTPYRYGGDSKNGIDCSAFVQTLYSVVFSVASLPRTAEEQYKDSRKIKKINNLKPGDLVFFKIHSRRVSHVGVYLQNNKFVNASLSSGVTISDLTDRYWQRYFVGGGEPKEALSNMAYLPSEALGSREEEEDN